MKKKLTVLLAALAAFCALTSCEGNTLPEGMDENTLLEQGRAVVLALNASEWKEIYDQFRSDAQETTSPEGIESYMAEILEEAGPYETEEDNLLTGQKLDSGEEYATTVLYCEHEDEDVMYRIAFSKDMELIGIQIKVQ